MNFKLEDKLIESTLIKKQTVSKKEACDILKIKLYTLKNLTKLNKIIEINRELTLSSVLEYKKELDERRGIKKPTWVIHGGYSSL
jgi:hypothetical protein